MRNISLTQRNKIFQDKQYWQPQVWLLSIYYFIYLCLFHFLRFYSFQCVSCVSFFRIMSMHLIFLCNSKYCTNRYCDAILNDQLFIETSIYLLQVLKTIIELYTFTLYPVTFWNSLLSLRRLRVNPPRVSTQIFTFAANKSVTTSFPPGWLLFLVILCLQEPAVEHCTD